MKFITAKDPIEFIEKVNYLFQRSPAEKTVGGVFFTCKDGDCTSSHELTMLEIQTLGAIQHGNRILPYGANPRSLAEKGLLERLENGDRESYRLTGSATNGVYEIMVQSIN